MAIFSISLSEKGKKLLTLKSPVDLTHIDTYECTSSEEISSIMTQAKVAQSEWTVSYTHLTLPTILLV